MSYGHLLWTVASGFAGIPIAYAKGGACAGWFWELVLHPAFIRPCALSPPPHPQALFLFPGAPLWAPGWRGRFFIALCSFSLGGSLCTLMLGTKPFQHWNPSVLPAAPPEAEDLCLVRPGALSPGQSPGAPRAAGFYVFPATRVFAHIPGPAFPRQGVPSCCFVRGKSPAQVGRAVAAPPPLQSLLTSDPVGRGSQSPPLVA